MSLFGDALLFVGKNLASGAVSYVGGEAAGWVLSDILGDDTDSEQLQEIGDQLSDIQDDIAQMETELSDMEATILAELTKIEQEQLYTSWQIADQDIEEYIAQVNVQYERYIEYAQNSDTTSADEVNNLVTEILNTNTGAGVSIAKINVLTTGSGSAKGALQLWAEMTIPLVENGSLTFGQALENYANYYTKIAYAQVRAGTLIVEAYNAQDNNAVSNEQWLDYQKTMATQEVPFLENIDSIIFATFTKGGGWNVYENDEFNTTSASYTYFRAWQAYLAGGAFDDYYRPTYEHQMAEEILANAQAMGEDDRRLVVWMAATPSIAWDSSRPCNTMIRGGVFAPTDLVYENINVQIYDSSDSSKTAIDATSSDYMTIFDVEDGDQHYIKRFVFTGSINDGFNDGFNDGMYNMVNANGTNGLVPVDGSNQTTDYFQDPIYLAYSMSISPDKQFDFMDFLPYLDSDSSMWHYTTSS